jgi:BASS family bile acid:Na+ symporter
MVRRIFRLAQSYTFVLGFALAAGALFPHQVGRLSPFSQYFLEAIFFLSALRLDLRHVIESFRDARMLLVFNLLMLIAFPAVVYAVASILIPQYALAFLILAAMPAGMTSPFLAEISGGNHGLALVLTVSTSLLAPLSIPLMLNLLAGSEVSIGFWSMVGTLARIIFIPFVLAQVMKAVAKRAATALAARTRPLSMVLLGCLIAGIVAQHIDALASTLRTFTSVGILAALTVLFAAHVAAGYYAIFWRPRQDRISVMLCLTFMNFTLAIYLAGRYFPEADVLMPVILSVLPWSLLLIPFRALFARRDLL